MMFILNLELVLGFSEYDAYIICSKDEGDQEFLVKSLVKQLEAFYKICIPDRDFLIGSG